MENNRKAKQSSPKSSLEEILKNNDGENKMQQERRSEIASKWMEGTGPEADIVISSRVRLARNIRKTPFPPLASDEQREKVLQAAKDVIRNSRLEESGFGIMEISALSPVFRQVLVEKHLISPLLSRENRFSALMLRKDEIVGIMINEEDHFRIQCLLPGLQLEKAWQETSSYDDILESHLDYAFDEEKGYLTACPTNVGTGLRASVMLHLPALVITQQINRILSAVSQVGLAVRGLYGEGTEMTGNLLQISNQITLGQSEEEILQNLYSVTSQLINQEKSAREHLLNEGREKLGDRAGRAYGILKNAWMIDSGEAMQLLSDVRLGVDLGLLKGISLKILNELLVLTRPGCLQYLKDKNLNPYERDLERAIQIQKCLP